MILKDPMLWRILWKEYRAQRSFWLVIAGFGIGLMLLLMLLLDAFSGRFTAPWLIAVGLPALYALGCGAVLFASEQEEGTTEFLRIMAARTSRLFAAKVAFSFFSTAALAGLLLAAARLLTWGQALNLASGHGATALYSAWATISLLVWGILFSTVCRKVLAAVCLAAVMPLIIRFVHQWFPWSERGEAQNIWYQELALSIPILCASYVLLRRTMAGQHRELWWPRPSRPKRAAANTLDRLAAARDAAPAWRRMFLRLVWLEVRHALSFGHILCVGGIVLFLLAISFPAGRLRLEQTMFGAFLFPTLMGVWTFQAEGGRRTRFLGELGLSPAAVWLSKQLVWLLLTVAVTVPFLAAVEIVNRESVQWQMARSSIFHSDLPGANPLAFVIALGCLGCALGQLASMLIPRGVTAGFVAFAIFALLTWWTWLAIAVEVPLWIAVAPLVVFMLVATLAWSRNWLLESATWRSWRRLALAIVAELLLVWTGVGMFRVLEVPRLDDVLQAHGIQSNPFPHASVLPITTAEAETAQMYRRARSEFTWKRGRPWESEDTGKTARDGWEFARDEERKLLAENQKALETTLAATARASCAFTDPSRPQPDSISHQGLDDYPELVNLILLSARQLESEGKLDDALERYVAALRVARHVAGRGPTWRWSAGASIERVVADWLPRWAACPGQSAEQIESAFRRVREELSRFPPLSEALQIDRLWIRYIIDRDWSDLLAESNEGVPGTARVAVSLFDRVCPWERYRARRLHDLLSFLELCYADTVEHSLATRGADPSALVKSAGSPAPDVDLFPRAPAAQSRSDEIPGKWARTTFPWYLWQFRDKSYVVQTRLFRELTLRALLIQLSLAGWKNAHGQYPARLDDLADANWAVTSDPYTGSEFGYRPAGFPISVRFINPTTYREAIVPAGEPVLWSAGPFNVRIVRLHQAPDQAPQFGTVGANGPIDERREKHVGAYVFTLP
jgi:ABC-type transport system involved in multi-copper enzyme maturation permease subunit